MAETDRGFERMLEALDEPAFLVSGEVLTKANGAAKALLGARIEGKDVRLALRQPQVLELLLAGQAGDIEISGLGGFERPWTVSIRPVGDGDFLVRLVDRTALIAAEKMRTDFVANASHELRTPLSTLVGYAETLNEDRQAIDEATQDQFVGIIHSEAKRMQRLVEDLISLSRIEGQRFSPPNDPVDLAQLSQEAAGHWQGLAAERTTELRLKVEGALPVTKGDRNQLLQLLDNLISNALRYGRRGGSVTVRLRADDAAILLSVADEGEGIAAKHLPRLTQRFYRVDKARSRESGGTGLGLAIVKHIVERHAGSLDIQSVIGEGTTVTVALPYAPRN
jgi:two-component system phosphate regulon sensor histidine kinase PhoR